MLGLRADFDITTYDSATQAALHVLQQHDNALSLLADPSIGWSIHSTA